MQYLSVKNFEKYQHYKKRRPPWIKFYRELLDDYEFLQLPDAAKWQYCGLLLLASIHGNRVPLNLEWIQSQLGCHTPLDIVNHQFLKDHVLASRKHRASVMLEHSVSVSDSVRDRSSSDPTLQTPKRKSLQEGKESEEGKHLTNGKSAETWLAYALAYEGRYHAQPVRNAKVNGMLARLVERLGITEAPQVAAFYVTHNRALYVQARHPTTLLLRDAEGLRTEWATGVKSTQLEAKSAEQKDAVIEQMKRMRAMRGGSHHDAQ